MTQIDLVFNLLLGFDVLVFLCLSFWIISLQKQIKKLQDEK